MSHGAVSARNLSPRYLRPRTSTPWTRPVDWVALTTITASDEKFVGLHAVYPDSNFLALSAAGNYTVDWGDGSAPENISSGVTAYHTYDYTTYDVGNTTLCSRGYKQVIVTVTPQGGQQLTALNLHVKHNQSGLPPYSSGFLDIAIAGQYLYDLRIGVDIPGSAVQYIYFYDLESVHIVKSAIRQCSHLFYACASLQHITALNLSTSTASTFAVTFADSGDLVTANGHGLQNGECVRLETLVSTTGISVGTIYYVVSSTTNTFKLATTFGGAAVALTTNGSGTMTGYGICASMFASCYSLQILPYFNAAFSLSFASMFSGCSSLQNVPLLDTAAGNNSSSMFSGCGALQSVPLYNVALCTSFANMFTNCYSLTTVPQFNTGLGTNFSSMFSGCSALQSVPTFSTAAGTNFNSMFFSCYSLQYAPAINTAAGTNVGSMLQSCSSLCSVPAYNFGNVTSASNVVTGDRSLHSSGITGMRISINYDSQKFSEAALTNIINNLGVASGTPTLTISSNYGAVTPVSLSGTTTAGSTTVTMASTTGIATGMQVTGTGTPSTTGIAVTFTDAGDTVNLTSHGLSDGDEAAFSSITSTTGIVINTIYYVVGATANTFQVAATAGGSALALTTDGSGTLKYKATVVTINANVSVILSRPATSSGTNTLAFRTLKTNTALLKGWTVTG